MEKKHIIKFLNGKKKGAYALLAEMYADVVRSMAMEIIKEDVENESGEKVELNYFSLAKAVYRQRRKSPGKPDAVMRRREFKDTNQLTDGQTAPGKFKIV
jgi:hypothetical protein